MYNETMGRTEQRAHSGEGFKALRTFTYVYINTMMQMWVTNTEMGMMDTSGG